MKLPNIFLFYRIQNDVLSLDKAIPKYIKWSDYVCFYITYFSLVGSILAIYFFVTHTLSPINILAMFLIKIGCVAPLVVIFGSLRERYPSTWSDGAWKGALFGMVLALMPLGEAAGYYLGGLLPF